MKVSFGGENKKDPREEELRRQEEERKRQEEARLNEERIKNEIAEKLRAEAEEKAREEEERRFLEEEEKRKKQEEIERLTRELEEEKQKRESVEAKKEKRAQSRGMRGKDKSKIIESATPSSNEDYYRNYKARIRTNKAKKATFTICFYSFIAFITIANLYFMFIWHQTPIDELASQVRYLNGDSKFPKEGVEEYLKTNFKNILSGNTAASAGAGVTDWNVTDIKIRKVVTKSDEIANVYFSADISTNIGSSTHSYILPLAYNFDNKFYFPTSDLITRSVADQDTININEEKSIWSFGSAGTRDGQQTEALSSFLDNFFTLMYNEKRDVSTMYIGAEKDLGDVNFVYLQLNSVKWFAEANPMGANCIVTYTVKSAEGLNYNIETYLTVEDDGTGGFKIMNIY